MSVQGKRRSAHAAKSSRLSALGRPINSSHVSRALSYRSCFAARSFCQISTPSSTTTATSNPATTEPTISTGRVMAHIVQAGMP